MHFYWSHKFHRKNKCSYHPHISLIKYSFLITYISLIKFKFSIDALMLSIVEISQIILIDIINVSHHSLRIHQSNTFYQLNQSKLLKIYQSNTFWSVLYISSSLRIYNWNYCLSVIENTNTFHQLLHFHRLINKFEYSSENSKLISWSNQSHESHGVQLNAFIGFVNLTLSIKYFAFRRWDIITEIILFIKKIDFIDKIKLSISHLDFIVQVHFMDHMI